MPHIAVRCLSLGHPLYDRAALGTNDGDPLFCVEFMFAFRALEFESGHDVSPPCGWDGVLSSCRVAVCATSTESKLSHLVCQSNPVIQIDRAVELLLGPP